MGNTEKLRQAQLLIEEVIQDLEGGDPPSSLLPPEDEWEWKNGNLWKPAGDHSGNLVVLIRSDWDEPEEVMALRKTGEWEGLQYTGQSNPDRYTYRGSKHGKFYAGRRKGGGVRCYYGEDFAFIAKQKGGGIRED